MPAKREAGPSRYEEIAMDAAGIKGRTRNPKRMLDNYLEEGEQPEEKNLFGFFFAFMLLECRRRRFYHDFRVRDHVCQLFAITRL